MSQQKDTFHKKSSTPEISLIPTHNAPDIYKKVRSLQTNKVSEAMISINDKIVIVNDMFVANKNRCPCNNLEPSNA